MRKESKTMQGIKNMCQHLCIDKNNVFHKSKLILSIYRDVVWISIKKADNLAYETADTYGQELGTALTYLCEFAPTESRQDFESRVISLFETKWLIDLIDNAMLKVRDYHNNGTVYFEILSKCYLTYCRYSENDLLEQFNMERSVFYDKKKEAIMLLGIAIWGYAIPQLQGILSVHSASSAIPKFFAVTQ